MKISISSFHRLYVIGYTLAVTVIFSHLHLKLLMLTVTGTGKRQNLILEPNALHLHFYGYRYDQMHTGQPDSRPRQAIMSASLTKRISHGFRKPYNSIHWPKP